MDTADIEQSVEFKASAEEVFEALMSSEKHSAFTGTDAQVDPVEGGKFSAYDGYIQGTTTKLNKPNLIEQDWRGEEAGWPKDHFSKVKFRLENTDSGCRLDFTQTSVPKSSVVNITQGWHDFYWQPLNDYFET